MDSLATKKEDKVDRKTSVPFEVPGGPSAYAELRADVSVAIGEVIRKAQVEGRGFCINYADIGVENILCAFNQNGESTWIICIAEGDDRDFECEVTNMLLGKWGFNIAIETEW